MALGPPVPTTSFVVVYNPSQYINSITNGQNAERIEALKHLFECITHSDIDLITLGSIWLCVTGLLTNEEQQGSINTEARLSALKCVLELIKIEQLQRRFFNIWLSFDFLARYKIEQENDAGLWLECFYALTDGGKRMDLVDDRLRARLLIQFIHGILTGSMNRNNQACQTLKDLLTNNCHLRYDELALIMEYIFRHLNRDDDDATNLNQSLHQQAIKKSFEFLHWLIDYHTLNTTLLHYFIQNIVDLHDKYRFSTALNTELLQLITNHLARAPWHNISTISVLCGIIVERLETPINNDIDPLSTLLFVLTQTLIDIRQHRAMNHHQVQLSNDDILHRKCFLNTIQQLPICWLTILHQVLIKRQNVNIILINFQQFLTTINTENCSCALHVFDMTVWKMMYEIMKISSQSLLIDQKSTTTTRTIYEDCLNIFEDLANKLCCLPHDMVACLFDIKRLTSITKTPLREQMIKKSFNELLRLVRPNNPDWSFALRELVEYIILNANEPVTTRIDVFTTVFDKYLWFKMTDQLTNIGQIILDALENLIHIDLNSVSENEFVSKHALMKQNAVKSIFEHFLSDHSIDSNLANHCYRILQAIYEQDCAHITSMHSIHRPLLELILEQMYLLFEENLIYTRLTSFNHCSLILSFFIKQLTNHSSKMIMCLQTKIRVLIWQLLFNIRIRTSDSCLGMYMGKSDRIDYGRYRSDGDQKSSMENENLIDLHGYLANMVEWLRLESSEVTNIILGYLHQFLKEQSMVYLSNINIDQLIPLLIEMFHKDLQSEALSSIALQCLIACTSYKNQIKEVHLIIDCFMEAMNSSKTWLVIMSIQALIISFSNLNEEIKAYIPRIIQYLTKKNIYDRHISKIMLEFFMHLLFNNFHDDLLIVDFLQILIDIINQYQCQTAHNLLLAHTLLCFYFNQLTSNQRQVYSYFIIRSLQQTPYSRDGDSISIERPTRLQRSGSLSSLNDDTHSAELAKRKMTVLDTSGSSSIINDDNNQLKKCNDELIRITSNYINDHFYEPILPNTIFILLPREVRRHHVNNSWLADEQLLYQIRASYDVNQLNRAKDFLAKTTHEFDETNKTRFRRYTDGNRQNMRKNKDLQILTTCQDDLHIPSLELDTNRSIFNERNLWIAVTVRSFASTKTFLAINLSASPGINHTKNDKLHWFEAVKLSDTGADKSKVIRNYSNDWQPEHNEYSIDESALKNELHSMIVNIDRKDEESLLNRHHENYFPQTVHRVPSEARKSIESIDNVEPMRIAKIGVVYIRAKQEITETNILSNIQTSKRYSQFMLSIAKLRSIRDLQGENFYCPLLDANNADNCGQYTYIWQNSIYQVLFHTSTMMPNTRADHEFKKKLIGNDYVIIVYNENDYSFDMKTLKTGVCQYAIEVCPQINSNYTRVRLRRRTNTNVSQTSSTLDSIPSNDFDSLISDEHVGSYVRILALCLCQQGELETRLRSSSSPYHSYLISPWQNRLQSLRSLHTRCLLSYKNRQ